MKPEGPDRRTFLKGSALAASALAVGCNTERPTEAGGGFEPDLLRALADVVLPTELGDDGREEVVAGFETWLSAYEPVPELPHGYGSQDIQYGPPDPMPRWKSQLEALDLEAHQRHGTGFAELDATDRRALLEPPLRGAPASLPDRAGALDADHIAVGLLGYFFGSSEATDLCYGRQIGGFLCRPLGASPDRPTEIAGSTAAAPHIPPTRGPTGASFPVRPPDRAS